MPIDTKIKQMGLFLQHFHMAFKPAFKVGKSLVKNKPNITGLNAGMSDPKACVLSSLGCPVCYSILVNTQFNLPLF